MRSSQQSRSRLHLHPDGDLVGAFEGYLVDRLGARLIVTLGGSLVALIWVGPRVEQSLSALYLVHAIGGVGVMGKAGSADSCSAGLHRGVRRGFLYTGGFRGGGAAGLRHIEPASRRGWDDLAPSMMRRWVG
jgi:hypothetical protein